ncbi:agc kinase [Cystoisospora suis]|uniref:Agc kinase n=1 Tax=Cystoisospora suis TaxID=483139 RepID=A0A2C6L6D5_9APIC|nr:agc kinase [Cystoisospora suis]
MKAGFLTSSSSRRSKLSEDKSPAPLTEDGKWTFDHFSLDRFLGRGNFCEVFEASLVGDKDKKSYALKIFDRKKVVQLNKVNDVVMERHCMLRLNDPGHPNVIRLVSTFKDEFRVCIVYELAENGELWELLKHGGILTESLAARYILQLVDAVEYIHSKGIIHRDIKAENITVMRDGNLKLIDFGTAVDLEHPEIQPAFLGSVSPLSMHEEIRSRPEGTLPQSRPRPPPRRVSFAHHVGTPQFMPPEAIENRDSGKLRDYWSLGCTIYQILTGNPPFDASTNYFVFLKVQAHDLHFPPHFPHGAKDLVERLLCPDARERLGAKNGIEEINSHYYLQEMRRRYGGDRLSKPAPVPSLQDLCARRLFFTYYQSVLDFETQKNKEEAERRGGIEEEADEDAHDWSLSHDPAISKAKDEAQTKKADKGADRKSFDPAAKAERAVDGLVKNVGNAEKKGDTAEEPGNRCEEVVGEGSKREKESFEKGKEKDKKTQVEDARWEALLDRVLPKTWREKEENSNDPSVRLVIDRLDDASVHFRKTLQWQDALANKWLKRHDTIDEEEETEEEGVGEDDKEDVSSQEDEKRQTDGVEDEDKSKDISALTHSKRDIGDHERCCSSSRN